jgi:hypothetical protein
MRIEKRLLLMRPTEEFVVGSMQESSPCDPHGVAATRRLVGGDLAANVRGRGLLLGPFGTRAGPGAGAVALQIGTRPSAS